MAHASCRYAPDHLGPTPMSERGASTGISSSSSHFQGSGGIPAPRGGGRPRPGGGVFRAAGTEDGVLRPSNSLVPGVVIGAVMFIAGRGGHPHMHRKAAGSGGYSAGFLLPDRAGHDRHH